MMQKQWTDTFIALMMETASISETSVNLYQTTQHNNPQDSHLYTRRRENPKSHPDRENIYWTETPAPSCTK
jgi:hypothetical protein